MARDSNSQLVVEMRLTTTDMASCTLVGRKEMDTLHCTALNFREKEGEGGEHFALHCFSLHIALHCIALW